MKEIVSTLTSKGQITIPVEIRRRLGVGQGDKLSFVIDDDGRIELRIPQYPDVASLAGAAGALPYPLSWKEMRDIARADRFAAERDDQ